MRRRGILVVSLVVALFGAACSSPPETIATIDGIDIARERFEAMHPDGADLVADERASTLLLLLIHDAFIASAERELGIILDEAVAAEALEVRTRSAEALGSVDEVLANRSVTLDRVRLEADLDALRAQVGPELVRMEAEGFNLDAAYGDYLKAEAHVCVNQILLAETVHLIEIIERINGGEPFGDLAREFSQDSLAQRPDGESGAGGDMGCSFPNSFGFAIAEAVLDEEIPVGEAFGPVISDRGLHVLQIYERELPALDDVRADVVESAVDAQAEAVFNAWAIGVLQRAEVTIHEDWGSWGPREGTNGIPTVIPVGEE